MKSIIAILLLTAVVATAAKTGTLADSMRADETSQQGDVTRLHGNAVVRWGTGTLFSEDIEYQHGHSDMRIRGDSRLDVVNAKPNPGFKDKPMSPKLFSADEIRQEGQVAVFHGNVRIEATGAFRIQARDATVNTVTGTITVKGDAIYIRLKRYACTAGLTADFWTGSVGAPCGTSDELGPLEVPR
jgi:lipopolysaccharide export system protein LptA